MQFRPMAGAGRTFQEVASELTGELVQRLNQEYSREVAGIADENLMLRGELQRVIDLMAGYLDREKMLHDMLDKLNATYAQATANLHQTHSQNSDSDARRRQLADPMNDTAMELQRIKQILARPSALPSDMPIRVPTLATTVSSVVSTPRGSPRTPIAPLVGGPFAGATKPIWQGPRPLGVGPPPTAELGIDLNHNGRSDIIIRGVDMNRDGIPDALQTGRTAVFQQGPTQCWGPVPPQFQAVVHGPPQFQPLGPMQLMCPPMGMPPMSVPGSPRPPLVLPPAPCMMPRLAPNIGPPHMV